MFHKLLFLSLSLISSFSATFPVSVGFNPTNMVMGPSGLINSNFTYLRATNIFTPEGEVIPVQYFTNTTDMANFTVPSVSKRLAGLVSGRFIKNDSFGGTFYYQFDTTKTNDFGITFNKWVRQFTGPINAGWFSPIDGSVDVTTNIQNALNATVVAGTLQFATTNYSRILHLPSGTYKISQPLVIPQSIALTIEGEGGDGYSTIIQWTGTNGSINTNYMINAQSVLGFRLRNITLIGQADLNNTNSAQIANGIITGRISSTNLFNSDNDWENVTVMRFTGTGVTFGRYAGYNGSSYPTDIGQTDNSYFRNLKVHDCRIGITLNTPNFLQTHFSRLFVDSYGGNPVDGSGNPIESTNAVSIKFRTKTALNIQYGHFSGESVHIYAPYEDTDPWSGYSIYCVDGGFNIISGYSEAWRLAYVVNGANGAGGITTKPVNSICNFDLFSGAAGGNLNTNKYPVYYAQEIVPLLLSSCDDIYALESPNSAGIIAVGCRSMLPRISTTNWTTLARNPRSSDLNCIYQAFDGIERASAITTIGQSGDISSSDANELFIHPGFIPVTFSSGHQFQYRGSVAAPVLVMLDTNGLSIITSSSSFVNGNSYLKTSIVSAANTPIQLAANGRISSKQLNWGTNAVQNIFSTAAGQSIWQQYGIPWTFNNNKDSINTLTISTNGDGVWNSSVTSPLYIAGTTTKLREGSINDVNNPTLEMANGKVLGWKGLSGTVADGGFVVYHTNNSLRFGANNNTRLQLWPNGVVTIPGLSSSAVVVTDTTNSLTTSATTAAQLGYLSTARSNIQDQIDNISRGETNTASNLASGVGVYNSKSGVDLRFNSLLAGTYTTVTSNANAITLDVRVAPNGVSDSTKVVRSDDTRLSGAAGQTDELFASGSGSTTDGTTPVTILNFVISSGTSACFEVTGIASWNSGGTFKGYGFKQTGILVNFGVGQAGLIHLGTPWIEDSDGLSPGGVTISNVAATQGGIKISVIGAAAKTLLWKISIRYTSL